jgi:DNA-binding transcriptional ArsR family regulator
MAKQPSTPEALQQLDDLLQHRTRLGVCVLLAGSQQLSFSRLKELLQESDGNLGAHLRKLEDAGMVSATKEFVERRPVTWYAITKPGRKALSAHLAALGKLISAVNGRAGS